MKTKWLELAHDKNCYLYPTALYWLAAQYACKEVGIKNNVIGCWYKDHWFSYMSTEGGLLGAGKAILKKLEESDELLNKIELINTKEVPVMLEAAEKLSGDLISFSGKRLYNRWQDWLGKFISMMTYSVMATVMEMEEPLLSNAVENILKNKLGQENNKVGEYFQILSSSPRETVIAQEEIELVELRLIEIENELEDKKITEHVQKYSWIGFGYNGPAWTDEDIKQRLSLLPDSKSVLVKLLEEKQQAGKVLSTKQVKLEIELNLNIKEQRLINSLRTLGFWKFERKALNQKAHVMMEDFITELAKRNNLSKKQACMIPPSEMEAALLKENIDANLMNQRIKESVMIFTGIDYQVLSGQDVKEVAQEIEVSLKVDPNIKIIEGNVAYAGQAIGTVKRVDEAADMKKMNQGDILVSTSTNPQIVSAMQKAGAIITDSGGITCHAAIVSRELKVPCVIGTKVATKILKDGDMVEVDAEKGIIKKLN